MPEPHSRIPHNSEELLQVFKKRLVDLEKINQELEQHNFLQQKYIQALEQNSSDLEGQLKILQKSWPVRVARTLNLLKRSKLGIIPTFLKSFAKKQPEIYLDTPSPSQIIGVTLEVRGWLSLPRQSTSLEVQIWLNEVKLGTAIYPVTRWDVLQQYPWKTSPNCGFSATFSLDNLNLKNGPALLKVKIFSESDREILQHVTQPLTLNLPVPVQTQSDTDAAYQKLLAFIQPSYWDLRFQHALQKKWPYRPLISLVTLVKHCQIEETIESLLAQTYPEWEFCLLTTNDCQVSLEPYTAYDTRVQIKYVEESELTAEVLLETSSGLFTGFLESGATLSPDTLYECVKVLNHQPDIAMLYTDCDQVSEAGHYYNPFFKPDWSPHLAESWFYTGDFALYRTELLKNLLKPASGLNEAIAYDFVLRLTEQAYPVYHIRKVLYHGRVDTIQYSTYQIQRLLSEHATRIGAQATVEPGLVEGTYRLHRLLNKNPTVTIVIPTRDQVDILQRCINSIEQKTTYQAYSVVVVDNDSEQPETLKYFESLANHPRLKVISYPGPFNYSAINNYAVSGVASDVVVFLNNDTEVISPDWLQAMLEYIIDPGVGAVGAKLLYPDRRVQHAGVVVGLQGVADHIMKGISAEESGYFGFAKTIRNVSAVTAACLMTRTSLFRGVGGFDEANLPVAFNDVDYCLRLREQGLNVVWTPYAELYHYEAVSRGADIAPEKEARLTSEQNYMYSRWSDVILDDPYFNPNLSRDTLGYAPNLNFFRKP
ncbi:MAG TPA: glycosyltransferase family 2 protein [Chloroflexia bacterium]|nr:glycosyltransferase family 2 protein [Chloroflexia bacterium]